MSMTFHCEYCGKKIQASDDSGGKWGKCPSCHKKLYVPSPDSGEELKLAPIDESDKEKQKQLMAETHKLTQDILSEKETTNSSGDFAIATDQISDEELTKNIVLYLRQMANGELGQAQTTVGAIAHYGSQAAKILDRIALSEMPEPELSDIPQQVLSSLIKNLRTKIG